MSLQQLFVLLFLTVSNLPTANTQQVDCAWQGEDYDPIGNGAILVRGIINPIDDTVTVQVDYDGEGWVGFAFSETQFMVPNVAVIGLPDTGTVVKYDLNGQDMSTVTPSTSNLSLTKTSISQVDGFTQLTFTKPLIEANETAVSKEQNGNLFIVAFGFTNELGFHQGRGYSTATFPECIVLEEDINPDDLDCSFQGSLDLSRNQDQSLLFRHIINQATKAITVELEYAGEAWLGFSFSEDNLMIPTDGGSRAAVIGLPESNIVELYDMTQKTLAGVVPAEDSSSLSDAEIVQENGSTILRFTQSLSGIDIPVAAGNVRFNWAFGSSNTLNFHQDRDSVEVSLVECLSNGETAPPQSSSVSSPTKPQTDAPAPVRDTQFENLGNGLLRNTLTLENGDLQLTFLTSENMGTITVDMTFADTVWISLAFSNDLLMPGSVAVIALPGSESVPLKYDMSQRSQAGVVKAPDTRQTLSGLDGVDSAPIISQNETHTTMKFTKLLVEDGEPEVSLTEESYFLYAWGTSNELGMHAGRQSFPLNLGTGGGLVFGGSPNKDLWKAHGLCMAIAWAILVPLAVASSAIRELLSFLPDGMWFQLHRALNGLGILLTVVGFGIAVHLFNEESGDAVEHFSLKTHHTIGLVVFIFAIVQGISGVVRPHAPSKMHSAIPETDDVEEGDDVQHDTKEAGHVEKTKLRSIWEYQHRIFGAVTMILGWYNCDSGINQYQLRFGGKDLTGALWGVIAGIAVTTFVLSLHVQCKKRQS